MYAPTFRLLPRALALSAVVIAVGCDDSSSQETNVTNTTAVATPALTASVATNVLTAHNDVQRTGQNLTETTLTTANVNSSSFGKLFSVPMDGKVYAQPLYVSQLKISGSTPRPVVFAATEHDSVYAFDAATGAVYWQVTVLGSGETPSDDRGCADTTPELGITATPVIDLTAGPDGTIYLVAMSEDADGNSHHRLHALDLLTGEEEFGGPTEITATYPGTGPNSINGQVVFDPGQYISRPGLLLLNGVVYTGWGSHCDDPPFTGWLLGYNEQTLQQNSVFNFAPNGSDAALWNSGGGIAADPITGRIFASVGNGTFDTDLDATGFPSHADFGNAFVRLNPTTGQAGGQMTAEDYWTMDDTDDESTKDLDLGSGGVLLLPDLFNSSGQPIQLGTSAGKDRSIYVFNRQNMGKFDSENDGTLFQELSGGLQGGDGEYGSPAYFNGVVYYGGAGDYLRALPVSAAGLRSLPASVTANVFGFPGTTPSISANGASQGIVWAIEVVNPAVLHAYTAANLGTELYNSNMAGTRDQIGPGNKFNVPTVADGRVIVGTTNSVAVFGLLK
jgi:hypothetical protein